MRRVGDAVVSVDEIDEVLHRLRSVSDALRARPHAEIVSALGRVGDRFLDEGDDVRRSALAGLPESAHVSSEMAEVILDGMARDWTAGRLMTLVEADLGDPGILDGFAEDGFATDGFATVGDAEVTARTRRVRAFGPRLCVQIVSGSVPGVGVHALIRSLLVKSPTLLKPGHGDHLLPRLFAQALADEDPRLAEALAVVYWPGGTEAVERRVLAAADVAVIYGSDQTVELLRARAPATTRVVAYHHRIGVGVVGRSALGDDRSEGGISEVAADVARAVALFERRGCVCPQLVYVEEGGARSPADFARAVALALEALERELPGPAPTLEEAATAAQLRETLEMHEAAGQLEVHHGEGDASWSVIFEPQPVRLPEVGRRSLRVRPMVDVEDLPDVLAPLGKHLQSVGHAGLGDRIEHVADLLGQAGASRVVPFRALSFPPPWWFHDGRGPLSELISRVEVEES